MRSITASQEKVRSLREQLIQAKSDLSASKPEVKNLVVASQRYDEMLRALTAMYVLLEVQSSSFWGALVGTGANRGNIEGSSSSLCQRNWRRGYPRRDS